MLTRIILALVAALAIAPALAGETATPPPFDAGKYPAEVQKALRYANEECTRQGGGAVTFAPDTVRTLDLTGDGRDDYVIQFGDVRCAERETVYCGSGGCLINILVALPNGRVRKVFDDYVRSYEIRPAPAGNATGPRTVRFELHGSFCGGHGSSPCTREQRIMTAPFAFKMPN